MAESGKRPYELGKRLTQMDQTRAAILRAARACLETRAYRDFTMASLAAESGVTRQTVHNLFGTKAAVLEAVFDQIALDGGMERMGEVMRQSASAAMLEHFVRLFCGFWTMHRPLIRRVHGIAAIDPDFGAVLAARNQRRSMAARRVAERLGPPELAEERGAVLAALTSFEFFDVLCESCPAEGQAETMVLGLARLALGMAAEPAA